MRGKRRVPSLFVLQQERWRKEGAAAPEPRPPVAGRAEGAGGRRRTTIWGGCTLWSSRLTSLLRGETARTPRSSASACSASSTPAPRPPSMQPSLPPSVLKSAQKSTWPATLSHLNPIGNGGWTQQLARLMMYHALLHSSIRERIRLSEPIRLSQQIFL